MQVDGTVSREKGAIHQQVDIILNVKLFISHRGESWFMLVLTLISRSMYVSSLKHVMILFTLFKVIFMAGKALNAQLLPVGVVLYCQTGSSISWYLRLIGLIQWECSVCYGKKDCPRLKSVFLTFSLLSPLCRASSSVELNPVRAFLSAQTVTLKSFDVHFVLTRSLFYQTSLQQMILASFKNSLPHVPKFQTSLSLWMCRIVPGVF